MDSPPPGPPGPPQQPPGTNPTLGPRYNPQAPPAAPGAPPAPAPGTYYAGPAAQSAYPTAAAPPPMVDNTTRYVIIGVAVFVVLAMFGAGAYFVVFKDKGSSVESAAPAAANSPGTTSAPKKAAKTDDGETSGSDVEQPTDGGETPGSIEAPEVDIPTPTTTEAPAAPAANNNSSGGNGGNSNSGGNNGGGNSGGNNGGGGQAPPTQATVTTQAAKVVPQLSVKGTTQPVQCTSLSFNVQATVSWTSTAATTVTVAAVDGDAPETKPGQQPNGSTSIRVFCPSGVSGRGRATAVKITASNGQGQEVSTTVPLTYQDSLN